MRANRTFMSIHRKIGPAAIALGGISVILLSAILIVPKIPQFRNALENRISASIPGDITFERLTMHPMSRLAYLTGGILRGDNGKAIAGFRSARAHFRLFDLIRGRLHVSSLELTDPWCSPNTNSIGMPQIKGHPTPDPQRNASKRKPKSIVTVDLRKIAYSKKNGNQFYTKGTGNPTGGLPTDSCTAVGLRSSVALSDFLHDNRSNLKGAPFADSLFLKKIFGSTAGRLHVGADLERHSDALIGSLCVFGDSLRIYGIPIAALVIDANLEDSALNMSSIRIRLSSSDELRGSARVGFDGTLSGMAGGSTISLRSFLPPTGLADSVTGLVSLSLALGGNVSRPTLNGFVSATDLSIRERRLEDITAVVLLEDGLLHARSESDFSLNGQFHLDTREFGLELTFKDTRLGRYLAFAGIQGISGGIEGSFSAHGDLDRLKDISSELRLKSLYLTHNDSVLVHANNLFAIVDTGRIEIPSFRVQLLNDGEFELSGGGNLWDAYRIAFTGGIPPAAIEPFVKNIIDASGLLRVSGSISATGSESKPSINAYLDLRDIGFTIPQTRQEINSIYGRVVVTPEMIRLKDIIGESGRGDISINGEISLQGLHPSSADLTIHATSFPITIPGTADMIANTRLHLKGPRENLLLTGEAALLEGVYYKDMRLHRLEFPKRPMPVGTRSAEKSILDSISLNITVAERDQFMIENNITRIAVNPEVTLVGTIHKPVVQGQASIESGTITYQRRRFEVEKGLIEFPPSDSTRPVVEIVGRAQVRTWTIILRVTGSTDNLTFALSSSPPEQDPDILSLLLFDKTRSELEQGEIVSSMPADRLLMQVLEQTFGRDIKDVTGLDQLELNADKIDNIKLTMGKQLTRRLGTMYSVETQKGDFVQRATAEYRILESISVTGYRDTEGAFGAQMEFRLEFQ